CIVGGKDGADGGQDHERRRWHEQGGERHMVEFKPGGARTLLAGSCALQRRKDQFVHRDTPEERCSKSGVTAMVDLAARAKRISEKCLETEAFIIEKTAEREPHRFTRQR